MLNALISCYLNVELIKIQLKKHQTKQLLIHYKNK